MATTAVTGPRFVDADEKEWSYRRENLRGDDRAALAEGEESSGYFKIREIAGYLPPWEAFCNTRCGFYQDFYQVRWEYPFSEIDYAQVENGCEAMVGATWEPDICLPAHLDAFRLVAKRAWIKKRREREQRMADERARAQVKVASPAAEVSVKRTAPEAPAAAAVAGAAAPEERGDAGRPPAKRARLRRDGLPLEQDLFRHRHGHDFAPEQADKLLLEVRSGWPKSAAEYPKGYGVASPPGFCGPACDCMDDQRPQRSWETNKAWLEDSRRSAEALRSIEVFANQTHFVRRRGTVSNMCYFETAQNVLGDTTHARAALELAGAVERAIVEVLKRVPAHALASKMEPAVRVPASAVLFEDADYAPIRFGVALETGEPLPAWLAVDTTDGGLSLAGEAHVAQALRLTVRLTHAEGAAGQVPVTITPERLEGAGAPWVALSRGLADRLRAGQLQGAAAEVLLEALEEIYDSRAREPRAVAVGTWLDVAGRLLRMLRSSAVANITRSSRTADDGGRLR